MRVTHSTTTTSIQSSSMMNEDVQGPISKVLVLNDAANSGLAALLSNLELILDADVPMLTLASNQRDAVLDLRKAAYGY